MPKITQKLLNEVQAQIHNSESTKMLNVLMKTKTFIFLFLFTLTILSLSIADIFSPTGFAQKRVSLSARNDSVTERIRRVENGLLPPALVKGEPTATMNLADRMRFYKTPGVSVAVINKGKIEWARGYGVLETGSNSTVTTETLFQAASISKPVAGIAVLRLVQENKLNLDEDVNVKLVSWKVPENDFTKERKVTLRGLLSHSASVTGSGFVGYSSDEQVPTLIQILDGTAPANSKPIRVDALPNKEFRYAGGGYIIMQQLLADITGKPFPALMQETILKKLGMTRSTYQQPLPKEFWDSAAVGHGLNGEKVKGNWYTYPQMAVAGLWTTPSDLARLAIEVQKSKTGKSNKILSAKMINEMLTPQVGGYGLGFALQGKNESSRFSHGGSNVGYKCFLIAYADTGQGAVVMTNSDNGSELTAEIMRSIAKEYGWLDYLPKEMVIVSVDPRVFDDYVGQYQLAPNVIITITSENGKLMGQPTGQPKAELFAESETDFFLKTIDVQIKFVKDAQGKVTGFVMRQRGRETPAQKIK
jgi:CubicO group peptidase (beta-lactamase class C family)